MPGRYNILTKEIAFKQLSFLFRFFNLDNDSLTYILDDDDNDDDDTYDEDDKEHDDNDNDNEDSDGVGVTDDGN